MLMSNTSALYPTLDQTVNSTSTGGMGAIFIYAESVVSIFDSLFFGTIYIVILFSIYFSTELKKGRGDFPVAFAVSSTVTSILAIILSLLTNNGGSPQTFVQPYTLAVIIVLTIISYIVLFFSEP